VINFESLEWAMGFQWPVIAVFATLLAIGIGRLILMTGSAEEEELLTGKSPTSAQKKRPASSSSAVNLVMPRVRVIRGVNARPKPARTMRHHAKRHQPTSAARSKQG